MIEHFRQMQDISYYIEIVNLVHSWALIELT